MTDCGGISVIIAHFDPSSKGGRCRHILKKTIESIYAQKIDFKIEIIICDDGSNWSTELAGKLGEITEIKGKRLKLSSNFRDLNVDRYLYLHSNKKFGKAILVHHAYLEAKHSKIVSLDDDHPFIRKDSLRRFYEYLDKYEYVRGRIIGPDGIPQLFSSRKVQGTTMAFRKELYQGIGGLGDYLFEGLSGEDDDFTWQTYSYLTKKYSGQKMACYAGEIVTRDLLSSRWALNSIVSGVADDLDLIERKNQTNMRFNKKFSEIYKISPGSENLGRQKALWMELPSFRSWMSEIYFFPIYHIRMVPIRIQRKMKRFKRFLEYCKTRDGRNILKELFVNLLAIKKR